MYIVDMFQLSKLDVSSMIFFWVHINVYTRIVLEDLDDRLDWVAGLDLICNPDKWLVTVSVKLTI